MELDQKSTTPEGWIDIDVELSDADVGTLLLAGVFTLEPTGILQLTPKGSEHITQWCDEQVRLKTGLSYDQMEAIIDA